MNENKFLDAVTNIDGELVERFIRYDENVEKLSKRKRIIRRECLPDFLRLRNRMPSVCGITLIGQRSNLLKSSGIRSTRKYSIEDRCMR